MPVRPRVPQDSGSLSEAIAKYAWIANFYDNWELDFLINEVYNSFRPLPEPEKHEKGQGLLTRQLPGYTIEGAMSKEIYERAFSNPAPRPTGDSCSPAERAGQVYSRDPSTFHKDLQPRLSEAADPTRLLHLRQNLLQEIERQIMSRIRMFWGSSEESAASFAKEYMTLFPTDWIEALRISDGIYGAGLSQRTLLNSVTEMVSNNLGGAGTDMPDFADRHNAGDTLAAFRIASSTKLEAWYCMRMYPRRGGQESKPFWRIMYIDDGEAGEAINMKQYLDSWSKNLLHIIEASEHPDRPYWTADLPP